MTTTHLTALPLLSLVVLGAASCLFAEQAPDDAVILCVDDDDCPSDRVCHTPTHTCALPGEDPDVAAPTLLSVGFDPPAAGVGAVTLTVTADEALAQAPPSLAFDGDDPGFGGGIVDGARALFTVQADALAEGAYPLRAITLTDVAGNSAERLTPNVTLVIDRRAPAVLSLGATHDAGGAGPFSAQLGTNAMRIRFAVDEAVRDEDVVVTAGGLSSSDGGVACARGAAGAFSCLATVDALSFTDVSDRVLVRATDAAGNVGEAFITVPIDLAPPAIVNAQVTVRRPGSTELVQQVLAGGAIVVDVVMDEPSAPPVLQAVGDIALGEVAATSTTSVRWTLVAPVTAVGEPGSSVQLTLAVLDEVGNGGVLDVGSVTLGEAIVSACPTLDAAACVDVDGDGDFAITASCGALGADCDDTDPLTRSDALEIPGDGVDNDCTDGDLPVDETIGVFIDADAVANGDGTRASPFNTVSGVHQILGERRWIFLATANDDIGTSTTWSASVLGGFDAQTWERTGGLSRVSLDADVVSDILHFEDVELESGFATPLMEARVQLRRAHVVTPLNAQQRLVAVDSRFDGALSLYGADGASALVRADLRAQVIVQGAEAALRVIASDDELYSGATGSSFVVVQGARMTVINSRIGDVMCSDCALVRIMHSVVRNRAAEPTLIASQGSGAFEITNSILRMTSPPLSAAIITAPDVRLFHNLIDAPIGVGSLVLYGPANADTITELNDCEPICTSSANNLTGAAQLLADGLHVELDSVVLGAGTRMIALAPDATALDVDGDCRFADGNTPDVGADER